jgi:hypothetical protein
VNTLTDDSREGVVAGAKAGTDAAETPHVSMPSPATFSRLVDAAKME